MKAANGAVARRENRLSSDVRKSKAPRRKTVSHVNQDSQDSQDSQNFKDRQRPAKKNIEAIRNIHKIFEKELDTRSPTTLNLPDYVFAAYYYDLTHPLPTEEYGDWHSPVFGFARLVKGHPHIGMLDGFEAVAEIEQLMDSWPDRDYDQDVWEQYFAGGQEDGRIDFVRSWEAVRFPAGYEPLQDALRKGDTVPLNPPRDHGVTYQRFISLAGHLQVAQKDQNIMLPLEKLADLLGVSPHTISFYRKLAEKEGLLKEVKPWVSPTSGAGRATEFRFAVGRHPELLGDKES